jgi:hypothetical protein
MARPWRGHGEAGAWRTVRLGVAGSRGTGAHARARVLEPQGRGVAVPCARHRHSGPAARCGGEGRRRLRGAEAARRVPAQEAAWRPDGRGSPRVGYRGFISGAGGRGERKGEVAAALTEGSLVRGCDAVAGRRRWVDAGQGTQLHRCRRSGAGLAELRWRRPSPPRAARRPPPPHAAPSPPLLLVRRRRKREAGRLGFGGAARALIPGARVWERLRPGVLDGRAGTRGGIVVARASRARAAVKARWKRGGAGGCALLSRSGTARWLAGDASERGRGGGEKGKRRGRKRGRRLWRLVARQGERRRGRSELGAGALRGGAEHRAEQSAARRSRSFGSRREKEEEEN